MFKEGMIMFLHAETSVHLGSGEALGAVDLAIQRERLTGWPTGAGSGLKGAVRRRLDRKNNGESANRHRFIAAFGPETGDGANEHAGAVAFTDLRLLLFPVRSMKGVFAWVTCPAVLGRLRRDLVAATGIPDQNEVNKWQEIRPETNQALGAVNSHACVLEQEKQILLDEHVFSYAKDEGVEAIADFISEHAWPSGNGEYDVWRGRLKDHLLVLHDDDFTAFTQFATEVQARVKLNEQKTTGAGGNLFYQENLPSESLLYSLVLAQDDLSGKLKEEGSAKEFLKYVRKLSGQRIQIGGDESVGKGIVCLNFYAEKKNESDT